MPTLIVETGTIVENANSYVDLAFADAYLTSRGNTVWAGVGEDAKAAALIRAADVLNGYRWKGQPVEPGRVMAWPRKGVDYSPGNPVPENVVPIQVQNAQCEIAAASMSEEGANDPLAQVDTTKGAVTSEKVDVMAVSYAEPSTNSYLGVTGYPAVDGLLRAFLASSGRGFGIVEIQRG